MRLRTFSLSLATISLSIAGVLLAQNAPPAAPRAGAQPQRDPARAAAPRGANPLDEHFAACLILENRNEIAASQIAAKRSDNAEVKEFAETMIRDHQQFTSELEKFAAADFRNRREQPRAEGAAPAGRAPAEARTKEPVAGERRLDPANPAQKPAQPQNPGQPQNPAQPQAQPQPGRAPAAVAQGGAGNPWLTMQTIKNEIADECQATIQRELSEKRGREFDACYMGMQLGGHLQMIDALKVLERHASPEFRPVLARGRETAEKHLAEARQLVKDVDEKRTTASK